MPKVPKVGVVLSGSGVKDGSEIHEAVAVLLAIDRAGAEAVCVAPNRDQMHVVNHLTDPHTQILQCVYMVKIGLPIYSHGLVPDFSPFLEFLEGSLVILTKLTTFMTYASANLTFSH